jgi:hypothetical protein
MLQSFTPSSAVALLRHIEFDDLIKADLAFEEAEKAKQQALHVPVSAAAILPVTGSAARAVPAASPLSGAGGPSLPPVPPIRTPTAPADMRATPRQFGLPAATSFSRTTSSTTSSRTSTSASASTAARPVPGEHFNFSDALQLTTVSTSTTTTRPTGTGPGSATKPVRSGGRAVVSNDDDDDDDDDSPLDDAEDDTRGSQTSSVGNSSPRWGTGGSVLQTASTVAEKTRYRPQLRKRGWGLSDDEEEEEPAPTSSRPPPQVCTADLCSLGERI